MALLNGVNSGSDYNLFGTLSGLGSSKKSSDSSSFSSAIGSMVSSSNALGDYSLIQSGAYKKLLTAYYNRGTSSNEITEQDKTEIINLNTASADASALNSSVTKLMSYDVTEENRSNIRDSLKSVVENYNSVIDSASEVDTTSVLRQALWMTQGTGANAGMLEDLGITVGENNKLSFDEEKFNKADLSVMKSMFTGNGSFMGRLASRSSQIASAAINSISGGRTTPTYNSSAGFSLPSSGSLIDTLT